MEALIRDISALLKTSSDTLSGLKFGLQLVHLDPSAPFRTIVVDYDDVVEQGSVKDFHYKSKYLM